MNVRRSKGGLGVLGLATLAVVACSSDSGNSTSAPPPGTPAPGTPPPGTPAPDPAAASVSVERAFPRLTFDQPIGAVLQPGGGHWWVFEKTGRIWRIPASTDPDAATLVADLSDRVEAGPSEAGLLGLAFHPGFATNGQVFLSFTRRGTPMVSTIARYLSNDGGQTLDVASEAVVLALPQPFENHNGGHILFGPDGYLYAGFGDGGSAGDPHGHGQNPNTLFATILRVDVNSGAPYAIPPDNPFARGGGRGEVWAYGLRNPWRFSFDRGSGQLWAADVGQNQWEEIDLIVPGANYGWNHREGAHCFVDPTCSTAGLTDPVAEYDHTMGCSITGGFVYRGAAIPALTGSYIVGDFCSGDIWALGPPGQRTLHKIADTSLRISSFAEDAAGELVIVDMGGTLHRLVPQP